MIWSALAWAARAAGSCRPVPQSRTRIADERLEALDDTPVGVLVEARHALRVGRGGQDHQALERAAEVLVERR